jgi:hypothetical protein
MIGGLKFIQIGEIKVFKLMRRAVVSDYSVLESVVRVFDCPLKLVYYCCGDLCAGWNGSWVDGVL